MKPGRLKRKTELRRKVELSPSGKLRQAPAQPRTATLKRSGGLRARSTAGAALDRRYSALRVEFLAEVTACEIARPGCMGAATEVHHVVNRSRARSLIADRRNFAGACRLCHDYVTTEPAWSKANGFTVSIDGLPDYQTDMTSHGYVRARVDPADYPGLTQADGRVYEHRLLAHLAGWLDLVDGRQVHHRNHKRADNRLANLRVMWEADHKREHSDFPLDDAIRLYGCGLSCADVAREIGTSDVTVWRQLTDAGEPLRPRQGGIRRST